MPLDELLETIVTLRGRIEAHGAELRRSETLTRYALIDPLLRELGWDTSDPAQVVPEYPSSGGRADYALLSRNGKPAVMVEAKKLGEQMHGAVSQGINYCLEKGTLYFTVTDGQSWDVYETHKPVPVERKRIVTFDLIQDAPAEACLKALALWRQSVAEGHVRAGEMPLVSSSVAERGAEPRSATTTVPTPTPVSPPTPTSPITTEGWIPLTQQAPGGRGEHPPEIRFPDNSSARLQTWISIGVEVARWVIEHRLIQRRQLPLQSRSNFILATSDEHPPTKRHPNGRPFKTPVQFGRVYFEAHGNPQAVLTKAKAIIQHAGLDPADFKVRLAD